MIKQLIIAILLFLGNYPLAQIRKHIITEDYWYGIFLGNYIFLSHYLLITVIVLAIIHYAIKPISIKWRRVVIVCSLVFVCILGYINYRYTNVTYTDITLAKKADVKNFKVVFISDLHLSAISNKNLFIEMVEKINLQNADVVIFGGDIFQDSYAVLTDDYQAILLQLQAKYGVYAILGNHEYYANNADENILYLQNARINIIRDEVVKIAGINIIGRDDLYRNKILDTRKSLHQLYIDNNIMLTEPIIVIDHNPETISESLANQADIQLSGHTHAGQFFPYNLAVMMMFENGVGYRQINNLHTIVSAGVGVGYWKLIGPWQMPYRIGSSSEINVVNVSFDG